MEDLGDTLHRQATAEIFWQYPRYRGRQDRFWDRPMSAHVECLVREAVAEQPLAPAALRRKLPAYAHPHLESTLQSMLAQRTIFRFPRSGRNKERLGATPPDARAYLRPELAELFRRLEALGFPRADIRARALELLHEEEWESSPPRPSKTQGVPPGEGVPAELQRGEGQEGAPALKPAVSAQKGDARPHMPDGV
jgi:hypothetical protein